MSGSEQPERPKDQPTPSADWMSLTKIAARAVSSLLTPTPTPSPTSDALPRIISPDTLREQRIPPRQVRTKKWPVLHAGSTPRIELSTWDLRLFGAVEEPRAWTWEQFRALPSVVVAADMHCVTRWSRLDNAWEGVLVREVMAHVTLKPEARFVLVHAEQGFTTNLPLDDFLGEDCLFAWSHDGRPLDPDHGGPCAWSSPGSTPGRAPSGSDGIEFLERDEPGFWERNGYHNHGDPWAEQRFS